MKKNQILALLLAAVMLLAVLTGCAAKTEPAQTEPAQTETAPAEEPAPAEEAEPAELIASSAAILRLKTPMIWLCCCVPAHCPLRWKFWKKEPSAPDWVLTLSATALPLRLSG